MPHRIFFPGGLILALVLIVGCSGVTAPVEVELGSNPGATPPVLTGAQAAEDFSSAHTLWGYYLVRIDEEHTDWEIIPLRLAANHWNVLSWMENGPCTNCFKLNGITPSGMGTLYVDVEFSHPFALPNFTGFDVRGIAMFEGTHTFAGAALTVSNRADGEGEVINPDGFTSLYNPTTLGSGPGGFQGYIPGKFSGHTIPNATLNPFMRYISDDAANTRNAFYAGEAITITYEIDMPDGAFIFGYAVDASWAPPINKPVTDPMTDFGPEANCPEPWKLDIAEEPVGIGLTDAGGATELVIDVYDWQGKSSHHAPTLECPEIFDGIPVAVWDSDGTGYTRYTVTLENENLAAVGTYKCLVECYDNENDAAPDWLDLSAYQIFNLEVHSSGPLTDPVANAIADPVFQSTDEPIHFFDDGSYDPDGGSITLYEWDWDNDGTFDETGSDLYHEWATEGTYQVQFRVTDDESATDTLDYPLEIQISNEGFNPIAIADFEPLPQTVCEQVHLFDNGSFDPDGGDIVMYEWDFDNDGTYDETGADIYHAWNVPGVFEVQFRVTDDESATGTLPAPLEVIIENALPTADAYASDYSVNVFDDVILNGESSYDNDCSGLLIVEWEWDIGNDGSYEANGPEISTFWEEPGLIQIQLRVTDDEGGTDTLDEPIVIEVFSPPLAFAIFDTNLQLIGQPVNFYDDGSYDPDGGTIVLYEWDWDEDGIYDDTGPSVSHEWNTSGVYYVQLQVTDDEGATDTLDVPLEITVHELPVAISSPEGGTTMTTVQTEVLFEDNGSYDPDGGSITMYEWDWNNDGIYDDSGESVLHDFGAYGIFQVQFRVTDDEGSTDTLDEPITIEIDNYDSWVNTWGNANWDEVHGVCEGSGGCIYVCGEFEGTVDFDPGPGVFNLSSADAFNSDSFLCKYDASGNFEWAYGWGGTGPGYADDVIWVPGDGLYITGTFYGTADFDPGPGSVVKTSVGNLDCYLVKYDLSDGFSWVRTWGGSSADYANDIMEDSAGNIYVVGSFAGTCDFDTGGTTDSKTSAGDWDCFIIIHTSSGAYIKSVTWGGSEQDKVQGICTDNSGNLFVAGEFNGTCDFDPYTGQTNVTSAGQTDCFMSKFQTNGDWYWVKTWGGTQYDVITGISRGNPDEIFISGSFETTSDFDPGPGTESHTSAGSYDGFLSKFNEGGIFQWVKVWGGTGQDLLRLSKYDHDYSRNLIIGTFSSTTDFDPGPGTENRNNLGEHDTFLLNLSNTGTFNWVQTFGGSSSYCYGNDIEPTAGNILIGGCIWGTVDFDPGVGVQNRTSNGDTDSFILMLGYDGTW